MVVDRDAARRHLRRSAERYAVALASSAGLRTWEIDNAEHVLEEAAMLFAIASGCRRLSTEELTDDA